MNVVTGVKFKMFLLILYIAFPLVFLTSCNTVFVLSRYTPILELHDNCVSFADA